MKKVYFDLIMAQPLHGVKYHGGGEYIKSVFKYFCEKYRKHCDLYAFINLNGFIDEWVKEIITQNNIKTIDVKEISDIESYFKKEEINNAVFFTGMIYPYGKIQFPDNLKTIGTLHGLRVIEKPWDKSIYYYDSLKSCIYNTVRYKVLSRFSLKHEIHNFCREINNFDIVITDSEHSRYSIFSNISNIHNKNIITLYPPMKEVTSDQIVSDGEYILIISANRWLKNSLNAILAIDNLYSSGLLTVRTRVIGELPLKIRKRIKNIKKFDFYNYLSVDELEKAYAGCCVFLYPTFNEGFGLPPMEAMKYGKTCIISGVCSLPELYGESVYYCNPYDISEIKIRILEAIDIKIDTEVINKRIEMIKHRQEEDTDYLCKLILED